MVKVSNEELSHEKIAVAEHSAPSPSPLSQAAP